VKFQITLKDPDGFYEGVKEAVAESLEKGGEFQGLSDDEVAELKETLTDSRRDKVLEFLNKFTTYSEYVTLEFDTEAGTATVVRR
jgi:hypothetical protein